MKQNILNKAIRIASLLDNKYSICAIITDKRGIPLSYGVNSYVKTSPLQVKYANKADKVNKIFNHAEICSIKNLRYNSKPYAIYIARVNKSGNTLLAKPCKICSLAIKELGIKEENIFYTK